METPHPLPRAGVDPIRCESDAWAIVDLAVDRPLHPQTILITLDGQHRGHSIVIIDGGDDDAVITAAMCAASVPPSAGVGAVVLASVRPGGSVDVDDAERWIECDQRLEDAGLELLEWFVVGKEVELPRELIGEGPRWRP